MTRAYLLDTHVWIWGVGRTRALSESVAKALAYGETWLSAASAWELEALVKAQRLTLEGSAAAWFRWAVAESGVREAPITHEVALEAARLDWPGADVVDRVLVATARLQKLTLVSADEALLGAGHCDVLCALPTPLRDGSPARP